MDIAALRQLIEDASKQVDTIFSKCLDPKAENRLSMLEAEYRSYVEGDKATRTLKSADDIGELAQMIDEARKEVNDNTIKVFFSAGSSENWTKANSGMVREQLAAATGGAKYTLDVEKVFLESLRVLEMTFTHAEFAGEAVSLTWDDVKPLLSAADVDAVYYDLQKTQRTHGMVSNPLQ